MSHYLALLEELKSLETQRVEINRKGDVLHNCWIAESKPGGTARCGKAHFQLRSRAPQFDGKKSKYLRPTEVSKYQAVIARGKEIKQLDKQIEALRQTIEKIETTIASASAKKLHSP